MKNLKKEVWVLLVLITGIYYAWWIFYSGDNFTTKEKNLSNREALTMIYNEVNPGDSYQAVLDTYWQWRTGDLRLFADNPDEWVVHTPPEFGAGNWMLSFEFENSAVTAVKVRTADGPPPQDGPGDKR